MGAQARRIDRTTFDELHKIGRNLSSDLVSLRYSRQKELGSPTRYAFVVSGKVAPSAVDRNRTKRRGRAILHRLDARLAPGLLCAFFFKKPGVAAPFETLESEIVRLLTKAEILSR